MLVGSGVTAAIDAPHILIAELHNIMLRSVSDRAQMHFEELQQGARHFRRMEVLSARTCNKLCRLDIAYNISQHVTGNSCMTFREEVLSELRREVQASQPTASHGTEAATSGCNGDTECYDIHSQRSVDDAICFVRVRLEGWFSEPHRLCCSWRFRAR